jgi:hypothetical protein
MPRAKTLAEIKANLLRPALTSHFEVEIPQPSGSNWTQFLNANIPNLGPLGMDKINFLCSEATLPGSNLATLELTSDFHGVTERHAYRRVYDDRIDLTFYVDAQNYTPIRYFETWVKYIVDESESEQTDKGAGSGSMEYFYRVRYPDDYVSKQGLVVRKFERDFESTGNTLEYKFIGSFPISVSSMPVSYDSSSLLKCTVSMTYLRYILVQEKSQSQSQQPTTPEQQAAFNNAQFGTSNTTLPGLEGAGALTTGGVPTSAANASGNSIDRRVEAGLPYVGRNTGPTARFAGI